MKIEFMYVEKAFLLECLAAFCGGGRNEKRGNPKVNEFDESISSTPDFHVNEVLGGGLYLPLALGAFIVLLFAS